MKTFVFTSGDVNGIGPEIIIKSLNKVKDSENRFICIIPENIFDYICGLIYPVFEYEISRNKKFKWQKPIQILLQKKVNLEIGLPSKYSGKASYNAVKTAFNLVSKNKADAIITAPISKYALKLAGVDYPGHTEMFAEWSGARNYLMMFISDNFKAALNTIHIPINKVSSSTSKKKLRDNIKTAVNSLKKDLGIKYPKVAVLGLNPHAGEGGIIGKEEEKIILPVIEEFPECSGPFSPDAFFAAKNYAGYDLVFGMYHDQVLIPFKMLNFNSGVNYTAGLSLVRTSPDHGTAYDIAWKGLADESSMLQAYRYAELICNNRKSV